MTHRQPEDMTQHAMPFDAAGQEATLAVGDVFVRPDNNTGAIGFPRGAARLAATLRLPPMPALSTMRVQTGAGFYSDV